MFWFVESVDSPLLSPPLPPLPCPALPCPARSYGAIQINTIIIIKWHLNGPILAFSLSLGNACRQLSFMTPVNTKASIYSFFWCFKWPILLVRQSDCYKHCSQDRQEVHWGTDMLRL